MSEQVAAGKPAKPAQWRDSALRWWPLGLATLSLDQFTKEVIDRSLLLGQSIRLLPVLDFVKAYNPGAAFSFLALAGGWQRWFFTVVAVVVSAMLLVTLRNSPHRVNRLQNAGLMLIVSGALGNVIDRLRHGHVVDFVHAHWGLHSFPAFNVADSCITIGAGLILLEALLDWRRQHRAGKDGAA
jgi:signal peptidase II